MSPSRPVLNDGKKGYSLKEKNEILKYIVDNKAYGDVKGRSFWITMENKKITTRTWQSMKEVFLKRILPDLRNPYYKLTREQILMFATKSGATPNSLKNNWVAKDKITDKILNRSMNEEKEDAKKSPFAQKSVEENKPSTSKQSTPKNSTSNTSKDSDSPVLVLSESDSSSGSTDIEKSVRVTRNMIKENNTNTDSQSSQPIESFPRNTLPSSTPRKSLRSANNNNENSAEFLGRKVISINNSPAKSANAKSPAKNSSVLRSPAKNGSILKSPSKNNGVVKSPAKEANKSNSSRSFGVVESKCSPTKSERSAASSSKKILLLSSNDSSAGESDREQKKNKSKKNLFGFSSGKTTTQPQAQSQVANNISSETDISSEIVATNAKPSTSINYVSPVRQNKFIKKQRSFNHGTSSDSDDENGSSSDSEYTYYRSSDAESMKRKGKKLYGLYRGKLIPLYEPKRKCCVERKELIAQGKISKKQKQHKGKGPVYVDDIEPVHSKEIRNGQFNDKGGIISKEIFNFWKMKYLAAKRTNDEILRLLAKQQNEESMDSVVNMLKSPVDVPDSNCITDGNEKQAPVLNNKKRYLESNESNKPLDGKKILLASKRNNNPAGSSKLIAVNDNILIIDSQKIDIIIDLLKKDMKPSQGSVGDSGKGPTAPLTPKKTALPSNGADSPRMKPRPDTNTEKLPEEIVRFREKEQQIFDKILSEKSPQESNSDRNIFTKSQLELLFDGKENNVEKNTSNNNNNKDTSNSSEVTSNSKSTSSSKDTSNTKDSSSSKNSTSSKDTNNSKDNKSEKSTPSKKLLRSQQIVSKPASSTQAQTPSKSKPKEQNDESKKTPAANASQQQKSSKESNVNDANKTNNLPESMDIDESVKFAINPKFFTILFPNEQRNNKSANNDIVPSSDDDTTRYALPKTSPTNSKKQQPKNRRSTGKVIKLKMFSNINKKDKRQSLSTDNVIEDFPLPLKKDFNSVSVNGSLSNDSFEIPLQKFSLDKNDIEYLEDILNENVLNNNENEDQTKYGIDVDKPLLEQELEIISDVNQSTGNEKGNCRFCVPIDENGSIEMPLVTKEVCIERETFVESLQIDVFKDNNDITEDVKTKPCVVEDHNKSQVSEYDERISDREDAMDLDEQFHLIQSKSMTSLDLSRTSLFDSFEEHDNTIHHTMIQVKQELPIEFETYRDLMSEVEDDF